MKKQSGFTLVEVTIILLVLVILSSIMLPQLGNYNRLARYVKVREDVGALCASIDKMLKEMWMSAFYKRPTERRDPIGLLVGPGATPLEGSVGDGTTSGRGTINWLADSGSTNLTALTDNPTPRDTVRFHADLLANHLQQNAPGGNDNYAYPDARTLDRMMDGIDGTFFGWRGPYFDELTADPWGNRYMVNTFALYRKPELQAGHHGIFTSAVVCYSAGPNGAIDSHINQPADGSNADGDNFNGWKFGVDDQGAILSAGGPF